MKFVITKNAKKGLTLAPPQVQRKFKLWLDTLQKLGLRNTRLISGYHDEPLQGCRLGQRSIRLNKAYRAIYTIDGKEVSITIIDVNKHKY
jgi:proteic killer suppression protein